MGYLKLANLFSPIKSTWLGGATMATNHERLKTHLVTRQQYLEHGQNWLHRRFEGQVE
jgi:actin-related protein 6